MSNLPTVLYKPINRAPIYDVTFRIYSTAYRQFGTYHMNYKINIMQESDKHVCLNMMQIKLEQFSTLPDNKTEMACIVSALNSTHPHCVS